MPKLERLLMHYLAAPWIVRLAILLALLIALGLSMPTRADEPVQVQVRAICKDGVLIGLVIQVPGAGIVTVHIPPDACEPESEEKSESARARPMI